VSELGGNGGCALGKNKVSDCIQLLTYTLSKRGREGHIVGDGGISHVGEWGKFVSNLSRLAGAMGERSKFDLEEKQGRSFAGSGAE